MLETEDEASALVAVLEYLYHVANLAPARVKQFLSVEIGPQRTEQVMRTMADRLMAEGRIEGLATQLLRQLAARFGELPAEVVDRVRSASIEELDRWALQVLDAETLESVFAAG